MVLKVYMPDGVSRPSKGPYMTAGAVFSAAALIVCDRCCGPWWTVAASLAIFTIGFVGAVITSAKNPADPKREKFGYEARSGGERFFTGMMWVGVAGCSLSAVQGVGQAGYHALKSLSL